MTSIRSKGKSPDAEKSRIESGSETLTPTSSPLVFISHDSRDAELAEAFAKLLKSVSSGMIKTFRSSDKKGTDGIDFGEEWFKRLMGALQSTSDVVCLFTERSIDRPWILFEAGVARGKLNTPVVGVACGIALSRVSAGPFYQFQNVDDSEEDLTKLVHQLAKRVPDVELDADVVRTQVAGFRATQAEILKKIGGTAGNKENKEATEENPIAKLAEEMKALPSRVAERLADSDETMFRRRRKRPFHPMMFREMEHMIGDPGDPLTILMAASLVRDDAPWLYELSMEVYRAVKSGDPAAIEREIVRLDRISEGPLRGSIMEEFGFLDDKQAYVLLREFPRMLHHALQRSLANQPVRRQRLVKDQTEKT
jgi:hypothetical protein